jgi:glycosyltransferase involved in cell wall biosynthesis
MKKPEVSIIIPTYNEEKYIGAALSSIRRQKFPRAYEIIIGDGCSKDRTAKIARDYGARVVEERYGTPSGGRHTAALKARGKILAFTGADVEVARDWLEKAIAPIEQGKADWVLGSVTPLDGTPLEDALVFLLRPIAVLMNFLGLPYVYAENMVCKGKTYYKAGGFRPELITGEDTDLAIRLRKAGRFRFVNNANVKASMRRVHKWGYWKYITFHTGNFVRSHFLSSPAKHYDPIR